MSWIVTAWTVVNVVGMVVAASSVWDAWLDIRALGGNRNGRRMVARSNMRAQTLRFFKFMIFTALGVAWLADATSREWIALGLLAVAVLMLVDSTADWVARRRIMRTLARR